MGIRIHKSMGYGIDFNAFGMDVDLDRLRDFDFIENKLEKLINDEFVERGEKMLRDSSEIMFKLQRQEKIGLYENVVYDTEGGDPNILQIVPFSSTKLWKRYSDDIDHVEWGLNHPEWNMEPEVKWIDSPLYPYIGLMRPDPEKEFGVDFYWIPMYKDREETKNAIPSAPLSVYFILKHLNIVSDDKISQLFLSVRPCIYSYWS